MNIFSFRLPFNKKGMSEFLTCLNGYWYFKSLIL